MLCIAVMIMLAVMMIQSVHTYSVSKAASHDVDVAATTNKGDILLYQLCVGIGTKLRTIAGNPSVQSSFIREEGSEVD